jgi:hypothetical protein
MGAVAKKTLAEAPLQIKIANDWRDPNVRKVEGFARLMLMAADKCSGCGNIEMHDQVEPKSMTVHCGLRCKDAHHRGNRCKKDLDAEAWEQRTGKVKWDRIKLDEGYGVIAKEFEKEYMIHPGTHDHEIDAARYMPAERKRSPLLREPVRLGTSRDKPLTTDDAW